MDSDPVTLVESDVVKCLSRVNQKQGIWARWLVRLCFESLCLPAWAFFTRFFQWLFNIHFGPGSLKMSTITPDPKKPGTKQLNDFQPVALTSVIAMSMERLVCSQLITSMLDCMDPLQFAYRVRMQL